MSKGYDFEFRFEGREVAQTFSYHHSSLGRHGKFGTLPGAVSEGEGPPSGSVKFQMWNGPLACWYLSNLTPP
jgi:hypothetical protein